MAPVAATVPMRALAFLFGAGASVPYAPGQAELVSSLPAKENWRLLPAQAYLKRAFPGHEAAVLSFEDLIGPLEIAEAEEYWYHFAGRWKGKLLTNQQVLDSLDTWLALALNSETIPQYPADNNPERVEEYGAFYTPSAQSDLPYARLLHALGNSNLLSQTSLLSLNYDILLDRCLIAGGLGPDYVIDGFAEPTPGTVRLLKLHGSLNWRICDSCHVLRNLRRSVIWPGSKCADCGHKAARPMLIRPTLLKDFRHRVWQQLWREAGHELAGAKTWVIIGYRLPLADVWILRLLVQSARSGGIALDNRRIIVVDPDESVAPRYKLMFPRAEIVGKPFVEWIEDLGNEGLQALTE